MARWLRSFGNSSNIYSFLILSEQKNNIHVMMGLQKCLKRCFFGAFDEKDNLSTCDSWCNDLFLINSVVHDSPRIDNKTTFSVWKRVDCQHFRILYVYFRSTSHTFLIPENFTAIINMTQRTCSRPQNHYQPAIRVFVRNISMIWTRWNGCCHVSVCGRLVYGGRV